MASDFNAIRKCSKGKEFAPSGSKFFPIREVPIMKRDVIEKSLLDPVVSLCCAKLF